MAQFYSAKRRTTTRQIITVSVNDLDSFGQGVARHRQNVIHPGLLPQENAEVAVTEDKKQYARAKVVRRLSDSPENAKRHAVLTSAYAAAVSNKTPERGFTAAKQKCGTRPI